MKMRASVSSEPIPMNHAEDNASLVELERTPETEAGPETNVLLFVRRHHTPEGDFPAYDRTARRRGLGAARRLARRRRCGRRLQESNGPRNGGRRRERGGRLPM